MNTNATVTIWHNNNGAARMRVTHNGHAKSVPFNYAAADPYMDALVQVIGRSVQVESFAGVKISRNSVRFRIVK